LKAVSKPTLAVLALAALSLATCVGGCDQPHSETAAKTQKSEEPASVAQTAELAAVKRAMTLNGIATILNTDALLQLDADIRAARITADFSAATAQRYRETKSLSRQIIETAERQAGTDQTQLALLQSRLKQNWGEAAPFLDDGKRQALIARLSAGQDALVRIDFAEVAQATPRNVKTSPLAGGAETTVNDLWPAPSGNLSMPGVSYFGVVAAGPGLRQGDRARAVADSPDSFSGVIVPDAAIVIFQGQSWCYVETGSGTFERRAVALEHPVDGGYLVTSGLTPGMRVVVRGASTLLSREAEPGEGDDDDDAPKPKPKAAKPDAQPMLVPSVPPQVISEPEAKPSAGQGVPAKASAKDDDDDDKPAKGAAVKPQDGQAAPSAVAEKRGATAASTPVDRD
jgi:hypothetical protein